MEVVPKNEKKSIKKNCTDIKKMQYYITKSRTTELVYFPLYFFPLPSSLLNLSINMTGNLPTF